MGQPGESVGEAEPVDIHALESRRPHITRRIWL